MKTVLQSGIPIQRTREVIIRCLIDHLGEDASALIKDFEVGTVKRGAVWLFLSHVHTTNQIAVLHL